MSTAGVNRFILRVLRFAFSTKQWFLHRLTRAGQLVAAGIFVSAIFGVNTHGNLSHQIFCFLVLLGCIAVVAGQRFNIPLKLRRRLPRHATVGQPFTYRLRIDNMSARTQRDLLFREILHTDAEMPPIRGKGRRQWTPYWKNLHQLDQPPHMGQASLDRLETNAQQDLTITIEPKARGRIDFTGIAVNQPEPLGLFHKQTVIDARGTVLVLPKLYRLPSVVLPGRRHFQPGGVALASSVGDSEEFVALRDYRPGDPLRRIHWKSWAKIGKPVVKEYQEEFFVRHALVLDTFHETSDVLHFEEAVSLAASFVSAQQDETLLDLMFVGPEAYCFTCGRGLTHTDKMLEILSGVSTCIDRPFDSLFPLILQRASHLSACICVFLNWDQDRQRLVGMLRQLNVPVEVFVIAPDGRAGVDPLGPMQDHPHRFHILSSGSIQKDLDGI